MIYQKVKKDLLSKFYDIKLRGSQKTIMEHLNSAIVFDLGDYRDFISLFPAGGELFKGAMAVEPRLPYDSMWVETRILFKESYIDTGFLVFDAGDDDEKFSIGVVSSVKWNYESSVTIVPHVSVVEIFHSREYARVIVPEEFMDLEKDGKDAIRILSQMIFGLLNIFLKLMQCKNIAVQRHIPSKSQQKRRTAVKPLLTYHTLVIRPTSKSRSAPSSETSGTNRRVHLQRGHFKTFTSEKPLLGHGVGTYWWQPHVRGRGNGMVIKDYKVETKKP